MRVYLRCGEDREKALREMLEADFELCTFPGGGCPPPDAGDVVLFDLTSGPKDWKSALEAARRDFGEEVRLFAILRFEQIRALDGRVALDDFVADRTAAEEVRARLRLMGEQAEVPGAGPGELLIDEDRYEVRVGGALVTLTFKEFELLRFLAARPGKVFTREVLLEQVWGYDYFGGARTVDVHIRRIRSKIEREGHAYIRTVRGVGYIFEQPLS